MASLYELSQNLIELQNMEDDFDFETMKDTIEMLEMQTGEKIDNIIKFIKNLNSDIEALKNEEEKLRAKRQSTENKIDKLKTYLFECVELLPNKKFKNSLFSAYIKKNAPSLNIEPGTPIPMDYCIEQEPKIDKKMLLNAIKEGKKIKGVELKQTESIVIK